MTDAYKRAYTEVLEIIKYFPTEEYEKIPKDKINYYKENMDKNYVFYIDTSLDLEKQNISKEASAILVTLFKDYFATDKQKEILKNLLNQNQKKLEQEKLKKYNPSELFNKPVKNRQNTNKTCLVEVKENFFVKFINFIKNIFKR